MGTSRGLDVSVYQNAQNWAAHKKNGVAFAFAKASEGEHTHDSHFKTHITGIKDAGLVPGAYHFAWPNQDAATEAANYIAAVKPFAGKGFTHWLDLEPKTDGSNYSGRSNTQIHDWAARWVGLVQHAFPGQRVGIYTSGDDIAKGHVPAGVPLWYPAYPGTRVDTYAEAEHATRPAPSKHTVTIWQFTSNPAGSGPNLDLNLCYMSAADLRTWAGGATTSPGKPKVSLAKLIQAAKTDPNAAQGHKTYEAGVKLFEAALLELGFLTSAYAHDGSYGTKTEAALNAFRRWYSNKHNLGWSAADCTGLPGKTSVTALGKATNLFTVTS